MILSFVSVIIFCFEIGCRVVQMLFNKIKNNDFNYNMIDLGYQIYYGSML